MIIPLVRPEETVEALLIFATILFVITADTPEE